jgi:hypothetical protein
MDHSETLKELDNYLDGWSGGINPRSFAALRDKIQVISIDHYPIGYLHLDTLTEQRIVYPSLKAVGSETADPYLKYEFPEDVDVWSIQMERDPDAFTEASYVKDVPHATRIVDCHNCRGTGVTNCHTCDATGNKPCTHCSGTGALMCKKCEGTGLEVCTICDGKGSVVRDKVREWLTDDGEMHQKAMQITEPCIVCSGKGMMPCTNCKEGSVTCTYCSGEGKINCDDCKGVGTLPCEVCAGKKMLMSTLITKQKYIKTEDSLVFVPPELVRRFSEYPFRFNTNKNMDDLLFDNTYEGGIQPNDYTAFAPEAYMTKYDRVNRTYEFFKLNLPKKPSERITRQRVTFFEADSVVIRYSFEQEIYEFMVDTHNMRYAAPDNPFLRIVKTLVSEAEMAFDEKKYGKAYDLATEASDQFEASEDAPDVEKLVKRIRKAMNQHYLYGLGGGILLMILLKFMSLISLGMTVVYIVVPILMTVLLGFLFARFAQKPFIRSDAVRVGIGGACSILLYLILTILF